MTKPTTPPPLTESKPSPVLLGLLILPLAGLLVAAVMILSEAAGRANPPTPAPATFAPPAAPVSLPGQASIEFTLPTLDGGEVSLSAYRGRVVFLNFWATWCEPCQREMPTFEAFAKAQPADGAAILAVNLGEDAQTVRGYLNGLGIDGFPILLDPDTQVGDQYGVFQLPVTFVIDQQGVVRYPKYGEITADELRRYTEVLTGG